MSYLNQDKLTKGVVDPADQFRWLEDRLIEAKKKNFSVSAFLLDTGSQFNFDFQC